jgi:hypothetical protein
VDNGRAPVKPRGGGGGRRDDSAPAVGGGRSGVEPDAAGGGEDGHGGGQRKLGEVCGGVGEWITEAVSWGRVYRV